MLRSWSSILRASLWRASALLAGVALSASAASAAEALQPVPPADPEVIIGTPPAGDNYSGVPGAMVPSDMYVIQGPACDYLQPSCDIYAQPSCDVIVQEPGCMHLAEGCAAPLPAYDCCSRLWTVRAEAIIWERVGGGNMPLVTAPVAIGTDDLDHGWAAGPRLTLIRHGIFGSCWDAEVAYFGIDGWTGQAALADIDNFQTTPIINVGGVVPGTIRYRSSLDSVEVNLRRGYSDCLTWLVGFRAVEVGEDLNTAFGAAASANVNVNNHLYGAQLGLDAVLWDHGGPFYANAIGKVGIYGNSADSATTTIGVGGALPLTAAAGDETSFIGEISLLGGYRLTERLNVVGGYNLLWVTDVALAPDQLATTNIATGVATLDTDGALFYHGVNVGLEYFW